MGGTPDEFILGLCIVHIERRTRISETIVLAKILDIIHAYYLLCGMMNGQFKKELSS